MAKFCPNCGKSTVKINDGGHERDACPDGHFVQYARTKIGAGALIFRDERVLLVERAIHPVGIWTLPSGHIEQGEPVDKAIVREVHEETGLDITPQGVVFIRNMLQHGISDIYVIFLCDVEDDQLPVADEVEASQARFVAPSDFDNLNVSSYTCWFVETYLANRPQPWEWVSTPFDKPETRIFMGGNSNV
jgi:ADP-ribose pyrophosphatase YjhB (NUDIX family)